MLKPEAVDVNKKLYMKEYGEKNRARLSEYQLEWYHRTNRKEYAKEWYNKNLEKNRELRRLNNKKRRMEIILSLGGKCEKCGFEDIRALQIDHVNGGGGKERESYGHSASALKRRVKKDVDKGTKEYQLLCANCNWIKREEEGELFRCKNQSQ